MNQATIEPTPEQLARIATLEPRTRAIFLEVVAISEEIIALKRAGLETREAAESVAGVDDDALDELRTLRVSRGIPAFSDWWSHRVRSLRGIDFMVQDIADEDLDDDAVLWRRKHQAALAVDQAIADLDPELLALINRSDALGNERTSMQLQAVLGMTTGELEDRAEAVLTKLIESGWRPPAG
jgi:hypothetical protein